MGSRIARLGVPLGILLLAGILIWGFRVEQDWVGKLFLYALLGSILAVTSVLFWLGRETARRRRKTRSPDVDA